MSRPKSEPVDPRPVMPRGATEFEEKLIQKEFQLVFRKVPDMCMSSFSDTYEYVFRAGVVMGKNIRELNSPTSEIGHSTFNASVRETAGAHKGENDGVTKSD